MSHAHSREIRTGLKNMKSTQTTMLVYVLATVMLAGLGLTAVTDPIRPGADPMVLPAAGSDTSILPADRTTTWNPGMTAAGGIPVRSTVCATLTPRGGARDDTAQIQGAINACPGGHVVQLAAGTFM